MQNSMLVCVNGTDRELSEKTTVYGLLNSLGINPASVVVEVNQKIIQKERFREAELGGKDRVEIVQFVGGGAIG